LSLNAIREKNIFAEVEQARALARKNMCRGIQPFAEKDDAKRGSSPTGRSIATESGVKTRFSFQVKKTKDALPLHTYKRRWGHAARRQPNKS